MKRKHQKRLRQGVVASVQELRSDLRASVHELSHSLDTLISVEGSGYIPAVRVEGAQANLGLASTEELLQELEIRLRIGVGGIPLLTEKYAASDIRDILAELPSDTLAYRPAEAG